MDQTSAFASAETEEARVDFKASLDTTASGWCEIVKDIVAVANSGGGALVFGVNNDGSPSSSDIEAAFAVDPATISDKVRKYTGQSLAGFRMRRSARGTATVAVLEIDPVPIPIVFTSPGTYDIGGGKQKTAFGAGTVYFRHGAKSEPGTTDDLRDALERELTRIRSSWLDGIAKVVTAPLGATVSVMTDEVKLTGADDATAVRLVNNDSAPAFKAVRTDLLYPYRQKELVAQVNKLLDGTFTITAHDVYSVRKAHNVDAQPTFFYKPQYSSPQYSLAFAEWMVAQYRLDPNFFAKARDASRHTHAP